VQSERVNSTSSKCSFCNVRDCSTGDCFSNEQEQNVRNVGRDIHNTVELSNYSNGSSGTDESPVSAKQLHSMFAAFIAATQTQNAKLASNLEE